jgi:eukaryotic-like serine/threonine-protein kinase
MAIAPDLRGAALDGRYELEELIGEGAFGRVYRGFDRRLERAVAIKVVKPWWAEDPEWVAVFEREARLLARVNHPGIVQIHDVGHCADGLYYVSELVAGEDLSARLRRAEGVGLPAAEARSLALGLCAALAGAHAEGIVHRDVKPANVLISRGASAGPGLPALVKVADFGVARLAESTEDGASLIVGTPRYMAPEQADGGRVTAATDVYAIGAILYEMLAGTPPFDGRTAVELAVRHRDAPVPPLPVHVDPELERVVLTALAKRPADRYPDAGAMREALEGLGADPGSVVGAEDRQASPSGVDGTRVAPRLGPLTIVNPSARRRSVGLLALVGVVLGLLIVAALLTGGLRTSPKRTGHRAAAPVEVPLLVGQTLQSARGRLRSLHLRVHAKTVAAPGIRPGTVTQQTPAGGHTVAAHGTVGLSVAEVPRWRQVTTFTGRDSVAFRIRGEHWRLLVSASSTRHCTLFFFCHSSQLKVLQGSSAVQTLTLGDGVDRSTVIDSGPGVYRVTVDPVSSSTRWSIRVQDDY